MHAPVAASRSSHVAIEAGARALTLEYAWVGGDDPRAPLIVFLHEGLGSLAAWRDFPRALCAAAGARGLVYSRPGYGGSTTRAANEPWGLDFMHVQAEVVLPALLAALGVTAPYHLLGHSDGGSIALIHAARFPAKVATCLVLAPHVFVEEHGLASIRAAREAYLHGDLRARLARYHDDVDSAFWGWNDVWLAPDFPRWQIVDVLPQIRCPVVAIQGEDDAYGTMAQIDRIVADIPGAFGVKLPACGHAAHRDRPDAIIAAARAALAATPRSMR